MPQSNHSSNTLSDFPATLHYRMLAEWEPHAATWLAWPHYHGDWPGKFEPIPWVYAEIIRNLAKHERVELIVNDASAAAKARRLLERADAWSANIRFHRWPTNRIWLRDSGCIFVKKQPGFARPDSRGRLSLHGSHEGHDREGHEFTRAVQSSNKDAGFSP
jgi:agmatine/peptidylarginine deiminase